MSLRLRGLGNAEYASAMELSVALAGWPTTDEWQAWFSFLALIVTASAAVAALVQLRAYIREREDVSRPYLVVDYTFRSQVMYVSVKNISGALAANVRLRPDKPFESSNPGDAALLRRITSDSYRIHQLAPGREIRWFLDVASSYLDHPEFPRDYVVTATYEDPRRLRRKSRWRLWQPKAAAVFGETFELSMAQWADAATDGEYDRKAVDELRNISISMKTLLARGQGVRR